MHAPKMCKAEGKLRRGHSGRFKRVVRGYLMCTGALTTLYVLLRLLVLLFVELGKWIPV